MSRALDTLSNFIAVLSMATLMIYVCFITVNVVARYVFNAPMHWVSDLGELLLPFALSLAFPAAAMKGANLSIQFLGQALGDRGFVLLECFGRATTAGILGIIAWKLGEYTFELHATGRTTVQFGIMIWPVWIGATLAFALSVPGIFISPLRSSGSGSV